MGFGEWGEASGKWQVASGVCFVAGLYLPARIHIFFG